MVLSEPLTPAVVVLAPGCGVDPCDFQDPPEAVGQVPSAMMRGRVMDETGAPVAGPRTVRVAELRHLGDVAHRTNICARCHREAG